MQAVDSKLRLHCGCRLAEAGLCWRCTTAKGWPLHRPAPAAGIRQQLKCTSHDASLQSASPGQDSQGCLHAGLCRCQLLPVICCSPVHSSVCPVLLHLEKVVL